MFADLLITFGFMQSPYSGKNLEFILNW